MEKRKTALIMEGGAMRGMFTCGVLDVFLENDITFDGAAGISAGVIFGINFKSKQIGRGVRYNKKYSKDPRYCSFRSLVRTGDLYGADFCYHEIPEVLDLFDHETFQDNPMEFYVGATDIRTGRPVYHKCSTGKGEDVEWMRASASMPLVSRPVRIGDRLLLDGGITAPVPYRCMEYLGYHRNVIILTQPADYIKPKASGLAMYKLLLRKYPKVAEAMKIRHKRYNKQMREIRQREAEGNTFVIRPPKSLGIKRTEKDPGQLERVYQTGRREAEKRLEDLKIFLGDTSR